MKCTSYNKFFEVIANKTRLKIIESVYHMPKCVTDICSDIKEEQSKVSHNLRILSECNFVTHKQDGKKRVYSLNDKTIAPIIQMVNKHVHKYCDGRCQHDIHG